MNTPIRHPLKTTVVALGLAALSLPAAVLPVEFSGGAGATDVDQFAGIAGSGWSSAWSANFHSGTVNGAAVVSSTSPLVAGGGNYLQAAYDTQATGTRLARLARQWDTAAIPLTSPFTVEFNIRSNVDVASANQSFVIFGSNSSASGTSSADSWKIAADGGGWGAFSGSSSTSTSLGAGQVKANETWRISITIDPVSDTFSVAVQNLTVSSSVFSVSGLALRNGADASLAWLNFHANGAASLTGLGFAIDSVSITSASAVPEPSSASLLFGAAALVGATLARRRRR